MDGDETRTYGALPPDAALALLGNEVRASILFTLSRARGGRGPPPVLSFSELRDRVDTEVDSSQFNYHLQELVGTFLERLEPEGEDAQPVSSMAGPRETGYRLRPEGTTLVRTIRAWSSRESGSRTFDVPQPCHHCGTDLVAAYENAIFAVRCPGCEYLYEYNLTPPGVLDGESGTLDRVAAYNRHVRTAFARGSCPYCGGEVDAEFQDPADTGYPRSDLRAALVRRGCAHCGNKDNLTVGELVRPDPRVVAFCYERGVDVTREPAWALDWVATDRHTTVRSRDPWAVAVTVRADGDALELVVDDTLAVAEV